MSYSKISFIQKMDLSFKAEPIFSRKSIWDYVQLIIYPFVLLALFICNFMIFNVILYFSSSKK